MADWDGRGLPPAAAQRLARAAASGVRTSLLDVPGAVSVRSVGLEPVGEVMGCMVQQIGWRGFGGCGYYGGGPFGIGTVTSSTGSAWVGYRPYVDALYRGYGSALTRMTAEARALGADGVVGVRLTADTVGVETREFVALGTAVRSSAARPPAMGPSSAVFTTDLGGADVAALLRAAWAPVGIALGISVAVRHDDWTTQRQSGRFSGPTEVSGYTELVQHVRADARARYGDAVRRAGAEGALVSDITLDVREIEPSDNHRDHVAEARVVGTSIRRTGAPRRPASSALTVLPLRRL